jgi:hypothetical protein
VRFFLPIPAGRFYLTRGNSAVTPLRGCYEIGLRPHVRKYRLGM